ncbi:Homeobox protein ATH1 [Morella rubra]|uniref:Homeobox protein ATH1 n=1 Tax=Morella rubra TaxID=262757 RepID=A0A6A1W398_9ROSI|nr:Homeobox protein ATH1 [Morella rubra]KAB1224223.1 Homeobox protein ATH1 [Morella rubra]
MENNLFKVQTDRGGQSPVVMAGFPPGSMPNAPAQSDSFDLNNQNYIMAGFPVLSALQGEPINCLPGNLPIANGLRDADSDVLSTLHGRNVVRDASLCSPRLAGKTEFQEQVVGGSAIPSALLGTFADARSGLQENLNNLAISEPSICPLDALGSYTSNSCSNAWNSFFATAVNCRYHDVLGNINTKYPAPLEVGGKSPRRSEPQPYSSTENLVPLGWLSSNGGNVTTDHLGYSSNFNNELSLTLARSEPAVLREINIPDQCSEEVVSVVAHHCLNESRLSSEPTSCNSRECSVSFGSYKPAQFAQVILGSRYLHVIQELLAQIANYSLENLDHSSHSTSRNGNAANMSFTSSFHAERWMSTVPDVDGGIEIQMESTVQRRTAEAKKTQLLALLEVVDDQYNQCMDEIHTVISAFHAATELDPQIHARFAMRTISFLYKNLRERISNHILAMGAQFNTTCRKEERSFESSFIQKQWALQQLKSKDHQLWRPQRGLPERSVSVLRAWMFQNFLHPYPKDAEKHLLAVKSGLTRSQVSNWFINARVRLWKPMIEEMYAEMNRRKARRDQEGTPNNHRSHFSINNLRHDVT